MKKFALITGASGGLGQAIALKLAAAGYSLYLHYNQNETGIGNLMGKLHRFEGEFIPIKADLSSKSGYLELASNIFSLDAIVHNAGNSMYGLLEEIEESEAESLIQIHVTSPLLLTKKLIPKLRQKKSGSIVVVSSIWGQTGATCEVAYSMVKGAQIAFAKALSKELGGSGIRVNAVAPGAIHTPMISGFSPEEISAITEEIPAGRLGKPDEVADSIEFLLSEKSSYITGQVIGINGGWHT
ncbi:SDR family oxidoreductase [Mesobacillus subterraneus]|uniref:elongation factor P 5-aminopentanone reductase n=1 Tax=Mesobacillus subterraneus TaxID=285983 RepID=UPI00203F8E8F|nr:SDR family oxidoreductase [Mesobacillus subterraneus]MCM3666482.1 SDR family oxidoreductase [Mesobacillus subterraneus]MCM3685481.1 SDR family oxidoreductase [Mesobacillus subterraneus]